MGADLVRDGVLPPNDADGLPNGFYGDVFLVPAGETPRFLGQPVALLPLTATGALIGGLGFAFTGALGAALALGAKRGGLLIAVVVLPLFIPPVVFGSGALDRAASGLDPLPALALLGAYVLFACAIAPIAGAAAIRNAQG
jgi:heme exporter protein B